MIRPKGGGWGGRIRTFGLLIQSQGIRCPFARPVRRPISTRTRSGTHRPTNVPGSIRRTLDHPLVANAQWRLGTANLVAIWPERDHRHCRATVFSDTAVLAEIGGANEHPGATRADWGLASQNFSIKEPTKCERDVSLVPDNDPLPKSWIFTAGKEQRHYQNARHRRQVQPGRPTRPRVNPRET
jgi:hypothetical protein